MSEAKPYTQAEMQKDGTLSWLLGEKRHERLRATVEALEAAQRAIPEVAKHVRDACADLVETPTVSEGEDGYDLGSIAQTIDALDLAPIIEKALTGALGGGR